MVKRTVSSKLFSNGCSTYFKEDTTNWCTVVFLWVSSGTERRRRKTDRHAQNSNVPFPLPIRVSFPYKHVNTRRKQKIGAKTHLDTNRNIREDPQPNFGSLERSNLLQNDLSGSRQLLRAQPRSIPFDPNPPLSKRQRGTLDASTSRDGHLALVSSDMLNLTRGKLRACPCEQRKR